MIQFRGTRWLTVVAVCAFVTMHFLGGRGADKVRAQPKDAYTDLETFTNVMAIVQKNYVEEVPTKKLVEGAMAALDRGDRATHDRLVVEASKDLRDCDLIADRGSPPLDGRETDRLFDALSQAFAEMTAAFLFEFVPHGQLRLSFRGTTWCTCTAYGSFLGAVLRTSGSMHVVGLQFLSLQGYVKPARSE